MTDAWNKVYNTISQLGGPNLKKCLRNRSEFLAHAKPESNVERELIKLVRSMAKGQVDWGDLFQHEVFFKPELEEKTNPTTAHVTHGGKYKGDLVDVLRKTIADYLSKDRTPYARLTTVVNSSGTGKSRMVDQLGTETITDRCSEQAARIPMFSLNGRSRATGDHCKEQDKEAVTPNSVLCVTGGLTLARWGGEVILGPSLISGASCRLGFPQGTIGFQRIAAVC
ncbi:hypothetical protein F5888DRAFT_1637389 [Russula emetica]|nr:hypothetical protein F5888DRAFT_1637389 [Russula emetica]